jgi:hypothetical protein
MGQAATRAVLVFAAVLPAVSIANSGLAFAQSTDAQGGAPPASAPAPAPHATEGNSDTGSTTDKRAVAEMLFYTARGLMEANKFAPACKKFEESYRLDPAAGTLLNLAVCHEKEGKLASAWGEYRQAQAEARRSNRPDREQLAKEAVAKIEPDLPYLTIIVPKEARVAGLKVHRNGVPLEDGAWETELPIDPGTNEITAVAPLYRTETKTVTLEKRQHLTVALDPLVLAPVVRPPPPFWTSSRTLGMTTIAGGVVAAGVGAVFGVMSMNSKSKSDQNCPTKDGELRCTAAGANDMSTAQTQAWVADVAIGVGAFAIVTGAVLMLTGGAHEESGPSAVASSSGSRPQGAWGFRVTGGPQGGLGLLTRSF